MSQRRILFQRSGPHQPDRLILGDNLDVMASMPEGYVDVVYIDPPFGTGNRRRGGERRPDSGYLDVPGDPDRYVAWLSPRLEHSHRLLEQHGSLFVHLDYRTVHYVKIELDRIFGKNRFVNEIIWCYSVGGKSRRRFGRKHDTILWYARTRDYAFFPDPVKVPRKPGSHMRVVRTEDHQLVQEKTDRKTGKVYRYPMSDGKLPEDWWTDIELLNRSARERTGWPTQKPERLLRRIIAGTCGRGGVVADWFCGSATTAVVAQQLDCRFIAVDREPSAIECSLHRLEETGRALADAGKPPRDIVCENWSADSQLELPM